MHTIDISSWQHNHDFTADTSAAEKRTHKVIALTVITMVVDMVAGMIFHSMALLADGVRQQLKSPASVAPFTRPSLKPRSLGRAKAP